MIRPIQNTNVSFNGHRAAKKVAKKTVNRAKLLASKSLTPGNLFKAMQKEDQQRFINGVLEIWSNYPKMGISKKKGVIKCLMANANGTIDINTPKDKNGRILGKGFKEAVCETYTERLQEMADSLERSNRECDKKELKAIERLIKKDDAGKTTVGDIAKTLF